jgi:hypothetical protein
MNIEVLKFRVTTSYTSKAGEWHTYKETLRFQLNQEPYNSAKAAEGQLGRFLADTMESGQWPHDVRTFAMELADFYGALLARPHLRLEDLAESIMQYNAEIWAWFGIHLPESEVVNPNI